MKTKIVLLIYSGDYKRWAFKGPQGKRDKDTKSRESLVWERVLDFLEDVPFGMESVKFSSALFAPARKAFYISTWKPVLL